MHKIMICSSGPRQAEVLLDLVIRVARTLKGRATDGWYLFIRQSGGARIRTG